MLSGSSRVQRRQPPPRLGEVQDQHQEHVGRGLGLGEGKGDRRAEGIVSIRRPLACRLMYPIQAWETPGQ